MGGWKMDFWDGLVSGQIVGAETHELEMRIVRD